MQLTRHSGAHGIMIRSNRKQQEERRMRSGKGDYDERDYRAHHAAGNVDDRGREERWHEGDRHDIPVRRSRRPEEDDDYRRGVRGPDDAYEAPPRRRARRTLVRQRSRPMVRERRSRPRSVRPRWISAVARGPGRHWAWLDRRRAHVALSRSRAPRARRALRTHQLVIRRARRRLPRRSARRHGMEPEFRFLRSPQRLPRRRTRARRLLAATNSGAMTMVHTARPYRRVA